MQVKIQKQNTKIEGKIQKYKIQNQKVIYKFQNQKFKINFLWRKSQWTTTQ